MCNVVGLARSLVSTIVTMLGRPLCSEIVLTFYQCAQRHRSMSSRTSARAKDCRLPAKRLTSLNVSKSTSIHPLDQGISHGQCQQYQIALTMAATSSRVCRGVDAIAGTKILLPTPGCVKSEDSMCYSPSVQALSGPRPASLYLTCLYLSTNRHAV